jgi:hypothetical protein
MAVLEGWAIAEFGTTERRFGYNLAPGGDLSPMHNLEVAAKVSVAKRLRYLADPEYRERLDTQAREIAKRAHASPNTYSSEANLSRSKKLTGRKQSAEQVAQLKERMSDPAHVAPIIAAMRKACEDPEFLARERIRKKNQTIPQKQRDQISAKLMGHPGSGKGEERPEISELMKSLIWITDGKANRRIPKDASMPNDWWRGRSGALSERQLAGLRLGWTKKE